MKRSEGNYLMAMRFRNKYAATLLNPATVAAAIDDAAMQGYRQYRITQEHPFDLSNTDAAIALEEWLGREEFHYVWRPTLIEQDPLRVGIATEYAELTICW